MRMESSYSRFDLETLEPRVLLSAGDSLGAPVPASGCAPMVESSLIDSMGLLSSSAAIGESSDLDSLFAGLPTEALDVASPSITSAPTPEELTNSTLSKSMDARIGGMDDLQSRRFAPLAQDDLTMELPAFTRIEGMIYSAAASGSFSDITPSQHIYNVSLDAGQTLSLLFNPHEASNIQSSIRLLDASNSELASISADTGGKKLLVQNIPISVAANYTIEITNLSGEGDYQLVVALNAALESETVDGVGNGSAENAQNIQDSGLIAPGGGSRYAVVGAYDVDSDFYKISLNAGNYATFALAVNTETAGGSSVSLLNNAGDVLAAGTSDAANYADVISNFHITETGVYYARVTGPSDAMYGLVVTQGAQLDIEPNSTQDNSQDITRTGAVVGNLGDGSEIGGSASLPGDPVNLPTHILDGSGYNWDITQSGVINDGTNDAYDGGLNHIANGMGFYGDSSLAPTEDGGREIILQQTNPNGILVTRKIYISPDTGFARYLEVIQNQGVESTVYNFDISSNLGSDGGTQLIATSNGDLTFDYTDNWIVTDDADGQWDPTMLHIIAGLGSAIRPTAASLWGDDLTYSYSIELNPGETKIVMHFAAQNPTQADALNMASQLSDLGAGALIGMTSQELSQVVNFSVATRDDEDYFSFVANAGDVVTIATSTPWIGNGSPFEDLDPSLQLFAPNGSLVAADENGSDDGRNAVLQYVVPADAGGKYQVRIAAANGSGDYYLNVEGYTGSPANFPLTIESCSLWHGSKVDWLSNVFPESVVFTFSAPLRIDSVSSEALVVNGQHPSVFSMIDGRTVQFSLAGLKDGDGVYAFRMSPETVRDYEDNGNELFEFTLNYDGTAPVVTDARINETTANIGMVLDTGYLDFTAAFSEALNVSSISASSAYLYNNTPGHSQYLPVRHVQYNTQENTVRILFPQLTEGSYTFVMSSGIYAFQDLAGNGLNGQPSLPLPSGQGGNTPDPFVLNFTVDSLSPRPFPTLESMRPVGSRIYQGSAFGFINDTNDSDVITLSLDAGSKVSMQLLAGPFLQARVVLLDPSDNVVDMVESDGLGQSIVQQNISIVQSGDYHLLVAGIQSFGDFTLNLLVNAAREWEQISGVQNDTFENAQDLNDGFTQLNNSNASLSGITGKVGSVNSAQVVSNGAMSIADGDIWGDFSSLTDGVFLSRGEAWQNGSVYWFDQASSLIMDFGGTVSFNALRVQADNNDSYRIEYWDDSQGVWQYLADLLNYSDRIDGGMVTRPDYPYSDAEPYILVNPVSLLAATGIGVGGGADQISSRAIRIYAVDGDGAYALSEVELVNLQVVSDPCDYYMVNLSQDQIASIAITGLNNATVALALFDQEGNLISQTEPVANSNVSCAMSQFKALYSGDFYVGVTGQGEYSLLVTLNSAFEIRSFDEPASIQSLFPSNWVVGAIASVSENDWTRNMWSWSALGSAQVSESSLYSRYEGSALRLTTSSGSPVGFRYSMTGDENLGSQEFLDLSVFAQNPNFSFQGGAWLEFTGPAGTVRYEANDDFLNSANGQWVDVRIPLSGNDTWQRSDYDVQGGAVAKGSIGLGNMQRFEMWADTWDFGFSLWIDGLRAGNSQDESALFRISVNAQDILSISTLTPSQECGLPLSDLNPRIELYNPHGDLIASSWDDAPDGRNALIEYTADAGGYFLVKVLGETGRGPFELQIAGATGDLQPVPIISCTPSDGSALASVPQWITIELASLVQSSSVDADDMTVDDISALDAQVNGRFVSFRPPAGLADGPHFIHLAAGLITDVTGAPVVEFSSSFVLDLTPPKVVGCSLLPGSILNNGDLTVSIVFDEPIRLENIDPSDIILHGVNANADVAPSSYSYEAGTRTLTVDFAGMSEDAYLFTLVSGDNAFEDVLGNDLDGEYVQTLPSGDDVPGGLFVVHFQTDIVSASYPAPLVSCVPLGSLVHVGTATALLGAPGDTDAFTIQLDAGQTGALILRPSDASIRGRLVLINPANAALGEMTAAAAGQLVTLGPLVLSNAGLYRFEVTAMEGSGSIVLELLLNTAVESESIGGADNGSLAAAQLFGTVPVDLGGGASLSAVRGRTEGGDDFYRIDLGAGDRVTFALASDNRANLGLDLQDATGSLLALSSVADNMDRRVSQLTMTSAGSCYLRVTGTAGQYYTLIAIRNADYDIEPEASLPGGAQDITGVFQVVGHVGLAGGGGSLSNTNAAYVRSTVGRPWGSNTPEAAMDAVFGAGHWADLCFETVNPSVLFGGQYSFVYLEGSDYLANELEAFLNANLARIEQFVASGRTVLINSAPNEGNGMSYGFGGVNLVYSDSSGTVYSSNPAHPIFQGPFSPVGSSFSGNSFAHSTVSGPDLTPVLRGTGSRHVLAEKRWGNGMVLFGGMTTVNYHSPQPQSTNLLRNILAYAASSAATGDYYSFQANTGDTLVISTSTPGGGAGEFVNAIDPRIVLYGPTGSELAVDDNSAGDGRNAMLTFSVGTDGLYKVRIESVSQPGTYVLRITGSTGQRAPFSVTVSAPSNGALLNVFPSTYRVDFSQPVLLTSVASIDLLVNGAAASNVVVVDDNTLEFNIASTGAGDGVYSVAIPEGALTSVYGQPLTAYAATFDSDVTSPRVIGSSIVDGAVLPPGSMVYTAQFSEILATADLGPEDVVLTGDLSGATYVPSAFEYDPATSTVTVNYINLPEDNYTLKILTSVTGFRDRRGNLLDGSPSFPLPSGDGAAGDAFVVRFQMDRSLVTFSTPLTAVPPLGGLIYQGLTSGVFNMADDVDSFIINIDSGQTLSLTLTPSVPSIVGKIEVIGPDAALLGMSVASAAGQTIFLDALPVTIGGQYRIGVSGLQGMGGYSLRLLLNTVIELESLGGAQNNEPGTAQNIGNAFISLDNGGSRASVLGTADGDGMSGDYFKLNLAANSILTSAVTSLGGSAVHLALLDDAGTVLSLGWGGLLNMGEVSSEFRVPMDGNYLLRVTGNGAYTLVVAKELNLEQALVFNDFENGVGNEWSTNVTDNSTPAFSRFLGRFSNGAGATLTLTTVPGRSYVLKFDLMIVDSWDGDNGSVGPDYFNVDIAGSQRFHYTFNNLGGSQSYPRTPDIGGANFGWNSGWNDSIYRQITIPFTASAFTTQIHFYDGGLQGMGDESWGVDNVIVLPGDALGIDNGAQEIGLTGNVLGYYSGGVDAYKIAASHGDRLEISTDTPGDGDGEPVNKFNPYLRLYGPAGFLVAVDDDGSPVNDGRNAGISYTVPEGGDGYYLIQVLGVENGDYTVKVRGASGISAQAPTVVGTNPTEGIRLAAAPSFIDLFFSEAIRVDSVDASDLTIDGNGSTTGIQIMDGRWVRFLVSIQDTDSAVSFTLAAGALADLQGQTNSTYTGSFLVDKTGPQVVGHIPSLQASAPFTQIAFLFNETINPATVTTADVTSFQGPGGVDLRSQITAVAVTGDQVVVTFNSQTLQGAYRMRIGPLIQDTVGNSMDQNGNGTSGESGDDYEASINLQSADLTVESLSIPPSGVLGSSVAVSWTVVNSGNDPAVEGWADQIWLSTDATYSANDIALLVTPVAPPGGTIPFAVGARYTTTVNASLPLNASLTPGVYYLIVKTDASSRQPENNENNNARAEAITLALPALPDLVVSGIDGPVEGISGQTVKYTWTLRNQGTGDASGNWYDRVFLSTQQSMDGSVLHLGDFSFSGTIPAGQSVTRTQNYTLPIAMEGNRWFIVVTDAGGQLYEHSNEGNNTLVDDSPMQVRLAPFPNLRVTNVIPPASAFSSQQAVVEWTVTNTGNGQTSASVWYDRLWLSQDNLLDSGDMSMGDVANPSYLTPGDSYISIMTVKLPQGIQGDYWFIIQTDVYNHVFEHNSENDNITVEEKTQVTMTPPPDLKVENIQAPDQVFSNQPVMVSWTVVNDPDTVGAGGITLQSSWNDALYLSQTPTLASGSPILLGNRWHSGALSSGQSYSASLNVTIPVGIDGLYYFIVTTDSSNSVFEHVFKGNNTQVRRDEAGQPKGSNITLTPPDLEVELVDAPLTGQAGHSFTFNYQVTNYGVAATPNSSWIDDFYLSADTVLDNGDLRLGRLAHYGSLPLGESYSQTVTWTLPNGLAGDFYVLARTDADNTVFEGRTADPGENNNVAFDPTPVHVVSNPPDLVIVPGSLDPWDTGLAGGFIRATWGVLNQGSGATVGGTWKCKVYASMDNVRGGGDDRLLATFTRTGDLGAGESYIALDKQIDIPIDLNGTIYLWVRTDADSQVYEGANENNNDSELAPVTVVQNLADLQVSSVSWNAPDPLKAGDTIVVSWTIANNGSGRTNVLNWRDRIYLSPDAILGNNNDIYLDSRMHGAPLDAGEIRTFSTSVRIPTNISGAYYLGVWTDADSQVFEGAFESNNTRVRGLDAAPIDPNPGTPVDPGSAGSIDPAPPGTVVIPELVLVTVDAPNEAYSGQSFNLSWSVRNDADSVAGDWYDQVYLSLDQVYDPDSDTSLGSVWHSGGLANGSTYTAAATLNIPRGMAGRVYVFVAADRGNYKAEPNELNNINYDRASMLVNLVPPADLVIGTITVPANASPGVNATIAYTVENQGDDAALGSWYDSIYFSADDQWDIGDAYFGRVYHSGNVAGHGAYNQSLTAPVPGVVPADYYLIVRSDIRNNIPESNESNNIGASLDQASIDAELIQLGVPRVGSLAQGQSVFYKTVELQAGETVRLRFDGAENAFSELYIRQGAMPSRNQYDFAANQPFVSDQEIILPVTTTGVYYVMAFGTVASGSPGYAIEASIIPFSIVNVTASEVGNSGLATVKITGARFNNATLFFLSDASLNVLSADKIFVQDSATAFVTFDMAGVAPGTYNVTASDSANGAVAMLNNALRVVEGAGFYVDTLGDGPTDVRPDRNYRFDLFFGNNGDGDTMAPLLLASSASNTLLGFSRDGLFSGAPLQILGLPEEGPLDILRPGSLNTVSLYYRTGSVAQGVNVRIEPITGDDSTVITNAQWEEIKKSVKPDSIPLDKWNSFWANMPARIGTTWGQYVQFLNRIAVQLCIPGEPMRDVKYLFARVYAENPDYLPSLKLAGIVRDANSSEPINASSFSVYSTNGSSPILVGSGVTDALGQFQAAYLQPGLYELVFNGYRFDMDRNGVQDEKAPTCRINANLDCLGVELFVISDALPLVEIQRSEPAMAVDGEGVTHVIYLQDGSIWHAYYEGAAWVGAQKIAAETASSISLNYSGKAINGSPGLIATWQRGADNFAEIIYSVGRRTLSGSYEWTAPINLTNNSVSDAVPALAFLPNGHMLVTYTTRNSAIQDDTDVYFNVVDIDGSALGWPVSSTESNPLAFGQSYDFTFSKTFGNTDVLGIVLRDVGIDVGFNLTQEGCEASAAGQASASGDIRIPGLGALELEGTGSVTGSWSVDKEKCEWQFDEATVDFEGNVSFLWKDGLLKMINAIPHPAAKAVYLALRTAINTIHRFTTIRVENGVKVSLGLELSDLRWFGSKIPPPFWTVPPTSVGEVSVSLTAGPYISLTDKYNDDVELSLNGYIGGKAKIYPNFEPQFTAGFTLDAQVYWFSFSGDWSFSWPDYDTNSLTLSEQQLVSAGLSDGLSFTFNPSGTIGTGNIYGSNALLPDVGADFYRDGAPRLAVSPDGRIRAVWSKQEPITGSTMGAALYIADFVDGNWTNIKKISGIGLINSYDLAFDEHGNTLVVWSEASSNMLGSDSSFEDLQAVIDSADLFYAFESNGLWNVPQRVIETTGKDGQIDLLWDASSGFNLAWVYADPSGTEHLLTSSWKNEGWSSSLEICSGNIAGPVLEKLDDNVILMWTADGDPSADSEFKQIMQSVRNNSGWMIPELFVPRTATSLSAENVSQPITVSAGFPPFDIPKDCCKCKKWTTQEIGQNQGCGFTTSYDTENCKKIITYKPCVRQPVDPNDITGPTGYGEEHWIKADEKLDYMIRFENDPDFATAPAQQVRITQQLDSDLDFRSFRVGTFGFGGLVFEVPANQAFYSNRLDLRAEHGYFVDVTAGIDIATGQAFWTLTTIDPATGEQPLDANVGFLVVNNDEGAGEGYVMYSVKPKRTAVTGDVVTAVARIVFDTNEPIDTPSIFNTLDGVKPASAVDPLPETALDVSFLVSWRGSDDAGGSALARFNIFVSDNGGGYTLWLGGTTLTEAQYTGTKGHTYRFYSVAIDNAGNIEDAPATADATTLTPGGKGNVGNLVWHDANANGLQDAGETGVPDVTVELHDSATGVLLASTTTDASGLYAFMDVDIDAEYYLSFTVPAGLDFVFSPINQGLDDLADSDVDGASGRTVAFTIVTGDNLQWDAGLFKLGSISGSLWEDKDADGTKDASEPGLPGWTVFIDADKDGLLDDGEPFRVTNAKGEYTFEDLISGDYVLCEVIPDGWKQTAPGATGAFGSISAGFERLYTTTGSMVEMLAPGGLVYSAPGNQATNLISLDAFRNDSRFGAIDGIGYAVAILDTGVDLDHPCFGPDANRDGVADRIVYQYDFANNDTDASDHTGHGSHVASVIASESAEMPGMVPSANIIVLKVFNDAGQGYFSYAEKALQWVIENAGAYHIAAVNMSFGDGMNWTSDEGRYGLGDELVALARMGVVTVAAAGNGFGIYNSQIGLAYPAADDNVVSVGAVWDGDFGAPWSFGSSTDYATNADYIASFSQRAPGMLDVFAPGALIPGANAAGGTATMRGTSMATPFVTGAAVLAQVVANQYLGRSITTAEFSWLLQQTGVKIVDGDNELDSVVNTGATYSRLAVDRLAQAILTLSPAGSQLPQDGDSGGDDAPIGSLNGQPYAYTITLAPEENREGVDFGNRPPNTIPEVQIGEDEQINVGESVKRIGLFVDPDAWDQWTLTVDYGDGTGEQPLIAGEDKSIVLSHKYSQNGTFTITVAVEDSEEAVGLGSITVTVNDPPSIVTHDLNYTEDSGAVIADGSMTVNDNDSLDFDGGNVRIRFVQGGSAEEQLSIENQGNSAGQIGFDGMHVTFGGVVIGAYAGTPLDFTVSLNQEATLDGVRALLQQLTYLNMAQQTPESMSVVEVSLNDGDGGASQSSIVIAFTATPDNPDVLWSNPADIVYGIALGGDQLNAVSTVAGGFEYTPAAGTVLPAGGGQMLTAIFTPADLVNYNSMTVSVSINVTPASLTVTADDKSKVYGAAMPAFTVAYSGFVNGEDATVISGAPAVSTSATTGSGVGSYDIVPTLGTLSAPNYQFTSFVNGALEVTPASLVITANNKSKAPGTPLPALTASCSGFVNGDTLASLSSPCVLTTTATANSLPGKYDILVGGAVNPNYNIDFKNGTLTVLSSSSSGGTFGASTQQIQSGGSSVVTFFTYIAPNANLIQSSIALERLVGGSWVTVGTMVDNGLNGDAIAGDGIYSLSVTLNEAKAGSAVFRSSASYLNMARKAYTSNTVIQITPP